MVKRTEAIDSKKTDDVKHENVVKYGELIILGYNGQLTAGDRRRRRSKFVLWKREVANGIKRSNHYVVPSPQNSHAVLDKTKHSISYTLSRTEAVIVEYVNDENTDMFQIGRSSDTPIDFVVMDTNAEKNAALSASVGDSKKVTAASTISRFACRIICDRNNSNVARIYAAGFDSSRNIFLGEKATKWKDGEEIDALTTNGVLIMHPNGKFYEGKTEPGVWLEVSVCGKLFSLRGSRSAQLKGDMVKDSDNILMDGTLIDLCGATLLWRSAEGLSISPSREYLKKLIEKTNRERPTCPVGLYTLVFPHHLEDSALNSSELSDGKHQPYAYLSCGHVQGRHDWGLNKDSNSRTCPMCLKVGGVAKLSMGVEASFYVEDKDPPDLYAFSPCGHVATEKTVKFWANVGIPYGTNGFEAFCPFCATLLQGYPGYVKLIFN
ncbi:protein pellino [Daktulosphaira vitifoliae]|uniref:protein pellino n=1 Tax=Daktulosphaira vitifoliae TaxID=58002 RepID=UPI0021A9C2B7|nr:protein pellino [Daktulosphaira vitifoliae]